MFFLRRSIFLSILCIILQCTLSTNLKCYSTDNVNAIKKKADLVIFSYNRALQLDTLLRSIKMYIIEGLGQIHVVYRASDEQHMQSYQQLIREFPEIHYHKQGNHPQLDFKPLTMHAIFASPNNYILFAVDDIIVTDFIDLDHDIDLLEKTNAYAFYYRLGNHVHYCYPMRQEQGIPPLEHIEGDVYTWQFIAGHYDWAYPNTVDLTLYRKNNLRMLFEQLPYNNPNTLEGFWAGCAPAVMQRKGLCYKHAKMVNIPLNRVQQSNNNFHMNSYTPEQLLEFYNQGLTIDIHPLYKIDNPSAHMDYEPKFILRTQIGKKEGGNIFQENSNIK